MGQGDAALADRFASSVEDMPPELGDFAVSVIEEGPQTREGSTPPLDRELPIEYGGRYYRFEYEIMTTHEETIFVIEIDYDAEEPIDGPTIAYEELPAVDREAVDDFFPLPDEPPSGEGYDLGLGHRYGPEDEGTSVLAPEPEYGAISYDGTDYPIRVERGQPVDVNSYEYRATEVAADAGALAEQVRDQYRFELTGLSSDEREIIESAIDEGYYVDGNEEPSAAFESLLDRFGAEDAIRRDEYGGDWLVRYDGGDYWASVSSPYEWQTTADDEGTPPATPLPE